jgi:signal transduction histidine kinase
MGSVGLAWLLGSLFPEASLFHLGLLAAALVSFPTGRPTGKIRWALTGAAVFVGLGFLAQPAVGLVFAAIAIVSRTNRRTRPGGAWYPIESALGVAVFQIGSWSISRLIPESFDPRFGLLVYQFVLLAVAIGFVLAARAVAADRAKVVDVVLAEDAPGGLDGLTSVLAGALHDPNLQVYLWHGSGIGYRAASGASLEPLKPERLLEVRDTPGALAAAVVSDSPAMDDPSTAEAIMSAVRLAVRHLQLEEGLEVQLRDLLAARGRLLAAADRQRQTTASHLRDGVIANLQRAEALLHELRESVDDVTANQTLTIALEELARVNDDVVDLVSGVPPALLGEGLLQDALLELAARSTLPVTLTASIGVAADARTEATLFYVCSEALTNTAKHARATKAEVTLTCDAQEIVLRVVDDGVGRADPSGSGLQGLADRLAANGGRLRVESPPGAGTTVLATVPR